MLNLSETKNGIQIICNNLVITKYQKMEVSIIKIGNSKGFRLSKAILERYHISDKMEMILEKGHIILRPLSTPRKGWDAAFKDMHKNGDDELLIDTVFDDESFDEWK